MQRILIIQTAFIGDLILTTPFIREVKKFYPDSQISIVVNKGTEEILQNDPNLTEIIPLDKKKAKSSYRYFGTFLKEIRSRKFDICFCPHFSYRSTLIAFFSGANKRIGYKQAGFSFLLHKKIDRPLREIHEVDKLYSLLYENKSKYPIEKKPSIYLTESSHLNVDSLIEHYDIFIKKSIILSPSSVWETKKFPSPKFVELIHSILQKSEYTILLTGAKSDFDLCESIYTKIQEQYKHKVFNLAGKFTLMEFACLISKAKAVITNDSSPTHFASAFNKPVLVLYGATVTSLGYSPLSDKQYISEIRGLDCRPCGIHGGKNCPQQHFRCMQDQSIETIYAGLESILT